MTPIFIDTNVFVRHFAQDHADFAARAAAFLTRIASGEIEATTSADVLVEVEVILRRIYRQPRPQIARNLRAILDFPGLRVPGSAMLTRAVDLYDSQNVDLVDALIALEMEQRGLDTIATFDEHFRRFPQLRRCPL